ncbi:hypothetical protein [Vitiosangium sp. GDMCC 1.1324]|uniref:hypothetical protein n=1 Tax=Vitiosangium sp. (strain GDMCC 1.1324) TaxID=2138576 RepID=UPI0018EE54C8|nr:hypothetical protein [Vitiosangium sp. GDMCC 1.1324]
MQDESLEPQDFSTWDGTPFFEGYPEEGRHVYIVKSRAQGNFTAYGALDDQDQAIFVVQGTLAQLDAFVAQVEKEGAQVTYGLPPFDTNTGGDKAETTSRPGLMTDNKTGGTGPSVPTEGDTATETKKTGGKRKRGGKK